MFKPSLADSPVIDAVMGNSLSALIAVASEWPGYESIVEKLKVIRVSNTCFGSKKKIPSMD